MATYVTSSSTYAQVLAAYDDNASYDVEDDSTKAKQFIVAARILLRRLPKLAGHSGSQTALSPELIRRELEDAESWHKSKAAVESSSTNKQGRVIHPSLVMTRG